MFQGEMWSGKQCHHTHTAVCSYRFPSIERSSSFADTQNPEWSNSDLEVLSYICKYYTNTWSELQLQKLKIDNQTLCDLPCGIVGGDATTANKLGGLKSISLHSLTQSKDQISLKQTVTSRAKWHWHPLITSITWGGHWYI